MKGAINTSTGRSEESETQENAAIHESLNLLYVSNLDEGLLERNTVIVCSQN